MNFCLPLYIMAQILQNVLVSIHIQLKIEENSSSFIGYKVKYVYIKDNRYEYDTSQKKPRFRSRSRERPDQAM